MSLPVLFGLTFAGIAGLISPRLGWAAVLGGVIWAFGRVHGGGAL
jgi:hypothetical protein